MKIGISKKELEKRYMEELDAYLDECDWITYVEAPTICFVVSVVLKDLNIEIDDEALHKAYIAKVASLKLAEGEWAKKYGIKQIISLIYDLIDKNDFTVKNKK